MAAESHHLAKIVCLSACLSVPANLCTLHQGELARLSTAEKRLKELKAEWFRQSEALSAARDREKQAASEVQGAVAQRRNADARLAKLDAQVRVRGNS
jgi:hypothetical protein